MFTGFIDIKELYGFIKDIVFYDFLGRKKLIVDLVLFYEFYKKIVFLKSKGIDLNVEL